MKILELQFGTIIILSRIRFHKSNLCIHLNVNDGALFAPNLFEFDIDMTWTNSDSVSNFEYAGGQFFLQFQCRNKQMEVQSYMLGQIYLIYLLI